MKYPNRIVLNMKLQEAIKLEAFLRVMSKEKSITQLADRLLKGINKRNELKVTA